MHSVWTVSTAKQFGSRAFFNSAPKLWNALPTGSRKQIPWQHSVDIWNTHLFSEWLCTTCLFLFLCFDYDDFLFQKKKKLILNIYFYISSFLSVLLSKALVHYCFLVFRRIGEYISLDLFYFVSLTNSCSLIHQCLHVKHTEQSHQSH